ncbi:class I SAM-dependent methyltransferase [Amycolatopsis sp. BJA-103]|uniref:class I SAM-dependent methyltransferase n=1 Tax=Amycolatopsis sp. BJA-103 TaxID=1911175 RepID=UPI000C77DF2A|nr:class I SAM-dependent methyltransferase [Amycolatopsis sp. BJA-103]AUI60478.1 methyltransferase type 11 [Amycolatopsis sp. BJA-103]PNE16503.1 SAM-dependent methyltransferase [Amycolatopsis sp. BJA-103]
MTFEELLTEGEAVPVEGWDFSWFEGRATEERPPWGYSRLLGERMATAKAGLDLQTGGGEVLAGIPKPPPVLAATEGWPPNVEVARKTLAPLGGEVVEAEYDAPLPFPDESFDVVSSRHPIENPWREIVRVLRPGGTFLSQQIGAGTVRELKEFFLGPQDYGGWTPEVLRAEAEAVGLRVDRLEPAKLRMEFFDLAAVVHFLRKVIWIVPGFEVDKYRDKLAELHRMIEADGMFVAHSRRVLVEAVKPGHTFE